MVFRFSEDYDKELIREVIKQKPFAAKYGEAGAVWVQVAEQVSSAIKRVSTLDVDLTEKQVQDRVRLLKKNWRAGEIRSTLGSGIEEDTEATNEQSHYETLAGLVAQYVQLKDAHKGDKKAQRDKKKADEAGADRCASQIVEEAMVRRALRGEGLLTISPDSEDDASLVDDASSVPSSPSAQSTTSNSASNNRRKSTFQIEVERQEKRLCADMEMRREQFEQQLQMQQRQHEERLAFEREQHESRMRLELERERMRERSEERTQRSREEAEERNRQLILQCAQIFGKSFSKQGA
ncbi:hypothetical protein PHYPSEUDO_002714 [Phytophthora pseudosyringae]|uniref:Uncharacterized protein n=1 Tax=Phytophthora pseudosyringae TaxID=221518 RepID=A0A8T1WHJ9_9STRA|nr:hypothetical protein PHYPSEUDO_002714 [Phytophthora pseudosyringae]